MNEILKIKMILEDIGIEINIDEKNCEDIDLTEYIEDSMEFMEFMMNVEEEFEIDIPDECMSLEAIKSLNGFLNIIISCKEEQKKDGLNSKL
ncbi:phosphopantetheine-binding protein [Eubacterium ventriosum]|jgi:acyl carrier protein|uniref:phosphopantetheine-binding protein n=1 Tax=Eubacterium ventriosum TaxID=39496 RepID=UPI002109D64A|nr:phosphopantetheine-binding protein [Eubacterium ventriosum]MCQ5338128.1 phosphopantetheine-binding protein [Eubacterium ventriosum]